MPLARIGRVCDLPAAEAAVEVAAYRDDVVAEAEAREQLASFLVDYLSGRGHTMVELGIRYAARSDAGAVRTSNEDTAYAGRRLWAVADGMRGPGGEQASAAAVAALRVVENADMNAGDLLNVLADAVQAADRAVGVVAETVPDATPATTLTAILWSGSELALVHIGDTRAYVLRDGALSQITHDHTYVQGLIDDGKLTAAEAESHPQRAMLTRALTGDGEMRPDLSMHAVHAGDRYLLCSDGLSTVVTAEQMTAALARGQGPAETVDYLVNRARSFVFSTAPPPPVVGAARAALGVLEAEPERVGRLMANARTLRDALAAEGLSAGDSTTQIVPIEIGEAEPTMELCERALERGVFAQGIRPPTVPEGSSRLRFTVMAIHREVELRAAALFVAAAARDLGIATAGDATGSVALAA